MAILLTDLHGSSFERGLFEIHSFRFSFCPIVASSHVVLIINLLLLFKIRNMLEVIATDGPSAPLRADIVNDICVDEVMADQRMYFVNYSVTKTIIQGWSIARSNAGQFVIGTCFLKFGAMAANGRRSIIFHMSYKSCFHAFIVVNPASIDNNSNKISDCSIVMEGDDSEQLIFS
jgi:hypothetical protein